MSLAAYQVRPAHITNLAAIEQAAQGARARDFQLQKEPLAVAASNARNQNVVDRETDLANYRTKALANDPAAPDALKGQPDKFKALVDAFHGMSPDEYEASVQHAEAFGGAARRVASFKDGTPEQQKAWDEELGKLYKSGVIDKKSHDHWVAEGPSPDIINEAMQVDDFVRNHTKTRGNQNPALTAAKIKEIDTRIARQDELAGGLNDRRAAQTDLQRQGLTIKQQELELKRRGLDIKGNQNIASAEDKAADNVRADRQGDARTESQRRANELRIEKGVNDLLGKKQEELGLTPDDLAAPETGKGEFDPTAQDVTKQQGIDAKVAAYRSYEADLRKRLTTQGNPTGKTSAYTDAGAKPPPMAQRIKGKIYPSPKGPVVWTGNGWSPAQNGG